MRSAIEIKSAFEKVSVVVKDRQPRTPQESFFFSAILSALGWVLQDDAMSKLFDDTVKLITPPKNQKV